MCCVLPPLQGGDQWQHSQAMGNPGGVPSNFTGGDLPVPQVSTMVRLLPPWSTFVVSPELCQARLNFFRLLQSHCGSSRGLHPGRTTERCL